MEKRKASSAESKRKRKLNKIDSKEIRAVSGNFNEKVERGRKRRRREIKNETEQNLEEKIEK